MARLIRNVIYVFVILQESYVASQLQSFLVAPVDAEVVEGQSIILPCQVSNPVGTVQWAKNGILLGFDPHIPGFPRYSLIGNLSTGIYDLKIINATLEDDEDFECQVGPGEGQEGFVGKAHLTVLLPPTSIQIINRPNGSSVRVKVSERLSLECEVKGGKPAPTVIWTRNSFKLSEDDISVSIRDESEGRQTVTSTLTLNPSPDDHNAYYSCEAQSAILSEKLLAGVSLDVLFPPGRPTIEGYRTRDKTRAGDTINLRCISRGGNPLARLVWTKNGEFIDHSYSTSDWEAENEISFVASSDDDGALYTCTASSIMTQEPMTKSVTLKVLYAPSSVTIKAQKEAKPGDVVSATCKTERSNPASEITWVVDGIPLLGESTVEAQEKGGWITVSKINVNVTQQDRNSKLFTCYAVNQELGETIPQTFSVSILYAPDPPNIFGYTEGNAIQAGKLQRLTCISQGGNPLPDLKWYKENEEVSSSDQTVSGNIVSREIAIIVSANDNGAKYHCKSTSKALAEPLVVTITLTVYFPPVSLQLKLKPKKPKTGSEVRLICESSSSNPAANITWWKGKKNDMQLTPITVSVSPSAENGGFITKATFTMEATPDDDGSMCTCQATNEEIQQSVHDTIILNVFYKPIFTISDLVTYEVKENDSKVIDMNAKANPDKITYQWKKGDEVIEEGPVLNITSAERSHSGAYLCVASNDIGESTITIILKVLYPAVILKLIDEKEEKIIIAEPESNVKLECSADGYPLTTDTIKWKNIPNRAEVIASSNGKSILSVKNVTQDISGSFTCTADNGIGSADTWKIILLVKHEPVIKSAENSTVFSDRGVTAKLYCTAEGIPDVTFSWTYEGVVISDENSRFKNDIVKLDHTTWQGILTIKDVEAKDFGEYICVARNEIGFETFKVSFLPDSTPDPPIIVRILNTSKNGLLVTWVPGFDGGHNQTHCIRFKSVIDPAYSYIDVHPPATNSVWVSGLKSGLEYEVAMKSVNVKGSSPYTTAIVKAMTLDSKDFKGVSRQDRDLNISFMEVLAGSIGTVFFLLLIFNIVLLALYYHKKDHKMKRKYSDAYMSSSSDIDSYSKPESEETTFTEYSSDTLKGNTISYDTISVHDSDTKSDSYSSSDEIETSTSSGSPSTVRYNQPQHVYSDFI
ncbi:Nephrin like protein [Argiope bruennichi]|uniref:Nephrin like protein n=1 Tax=Argiope bruennichi TaxID=94029 RepID=A0A8T0ETJ1_ARGBR|nr:Nephrin like protein [Argiope bruennichi]